MASSTRKQVLFRILIVLPPFLVALISLATNHRVNAALPTTPEKQASLSHTDADHSDTGSNRYDRGTAQVINAIVADMWPGLGKDLLANMRANPILVDPYLLKLKGGKLRYAPTVRNIHLISHNDTTEKTPPAPPRFTCELFYQGHPDIELVLTGANGLNKPQQKIKAAKIIAVSLWKRILRKLVPDIQVDIVSIDLHARLEVKLDMRKKSVTIFFLERPRVEWDLEFSLTKAEIPLLGEDSLDTILTSVLEKINRENPMHVKF